MTPEKQSVRKMFNEIAPRYDFLNHFLSLGIDRWWRRRLVSEIRSAEPRSILDVATGTGDLAIAISALSGCRVTGIDISSGMIEIGMEKVKKAGLLELISFREADAEAIPYPDDSFDAVTVAFGVRNFENLMTGLAEMRRIIRPGGSMFILEFSYPNHFPVRQLYALYSSVFIPTAGKLISHHQTAYRYLPETVAAFPSGKPFLNILSSAGMTSVRQIRLTCGIASIYCAVK